MRASVGIVLIAAVLAASSSAGPLATLLLAQRAQPGQSPSGQSRQCTCGCEGKAAGHCCCCEGMAADLGGSQGTSTETVVRDCPCSRSAVTFTFDCDDWLASAFSFQLQLGQVDIATPPADVGVDLADLGPAAPPPRCA